MYIYICIYERTNASNWVKSYTDLSQTRYQRRVPKLLALFLLVAIVSEVSKHGRQISLPFTVFG